MPLYGPFMGPRELLLGGEEEAGALNLPLCWLLGEGTASSADPCQSGLGPGPGPLGNNPGAGTVKEDGRERGLMKGSQPQ